MARSGENIYKRKDGRWEGRYIKGYSSGKIRYGYIYGKTYKDVKARLIQAKAEWQEPHSLIKSENDDMFFNLANAWLNSSKILLKESSWVKYNNLMRSYILPIFGNRCISDITDEDIFNFSDELLNLGGKNAQGLSSKTVSDILSLLRNIQKYAVRKNININYTLCCSPVKMHPKPLHVFSIQEQQIICSYLKENLTFSNLGILLCLFTGIRLGELCALKWKDISIADKTLYIHQTMQRLPIYDDGLKRTKIIISPPKSSCSIRVIPIPEIIIQDLISLQQSPETYFLTGDMTKFIEPRTMQNRFKTVLKYCKINETNFHVLRHTFATRCVEVGFDTKSLSEILGHASVNITLNRYVHPTLELKHQNMSKLSNLFSV